MQACSVRLAQPFMLLYYHNFLKSQSFYSKKMGFFTPRKTPFFDALKNELKIKPGAGSASAVHRPLGLVLSKVGVEPFDVEPALPLVFIIDHVSICCRASMGTRQKYFRFMPALGRVSDMPANCLLQFVRLLLAWRAKPGMLVLD